MEEDTERLIMAQDSGGGRKGREATTQMERKDLNWLEYVGSLGKEVKMKNLLQNGKFQE